MKLKKPPVSSGGGYTDSFRLEAGKTNIRIFPFIDGEGEENLATMIKIHFEGGAGAPVPCLGKGCPLCAEAIKTKNNKLKAVVRYPMAVVPQGETEIKRFDCPSSLYERISVLLDDYDEDELAEVLGNEGTDFTVTYNKGSKNPSNTYLVQLRRKGSAELEVDAGNVPNLTKECTDEMDRKMVGGNDTTPAEEEEEPAEEVVFTDAKGKEQTGTYTGKMQGDKYIIESDGHLRRVPADRIISGIEIEEPESEEEEEEGGFKVDDRVTVEIEGENYEGVVTKCDEDGVDVTFDDGDEGSYEAEDCTLIDADAPPADEEAEEEEEEEEEPADDAPKFSKGDNVIVNDADDGKLECTVVSYDADAGTVKVENDEYDAWDADEDTVELA